MNNRVSIFHSSCNVPRHMLPTRIVTSQTSRAAAPRIGARANMNCCSVARFLKDKEVDGQPFGMVSRRRFEEGEGGWDAGSKHA